MPASPTLVTLDHAKDWAKRLAKAQPNITTLAQAQAAVATMLGHASWHAMDRFYEQKVPTPPAAGPATTKDPLFGPLVDFFNAKHPDLNAEMVEVLAIETEELEGGIDGVMEKARELEDEGYYREDAIEKAIEDMTVKIHPPPGYSMIRVRDGNNKATLLMISREDYQRIMPAPEKRPKSP